MCGTGRFVMMAQMEELRQTRLAAAMEHEEQMRMAAEAKINATNERLVGRRLEDHASMVQGEGTELPAQQVPWPGQQRSGSRQAGR